jgi:hypothetical protein
VPGLPTLRAPRPPGTVPYRDGEAGGGACSGLGEAPAFRSIIKRRKLHPDDKTRTFLEKLINYVHN